MPESRAQVRWAHAVLGGGASGDRGFAQEVVSKMHGKKMSSLPERAGRKVHRVKKKDLKRR